MKINRYYQPNHSKLSQAMFCLLIASTFIFCVFIQKNEFSVIVERAMAEEPQALPLQPQNSIIEKIENTFGKDFRIAVAIARAESNLDPKLHSHIDKTKDGRSFSIGLMQTNLTVHKVGGLNCPSAFRGQNYGAVVINESLYRECVKLAENPDINLLVAKDIFQHRGWWAWGSFTNKSYKKFIF